MNNSLTTQEPVIVAAGLPAELVRGEEKPFLDRLLPLVTQCPVVLDLAQVERIDAAGIAVLITLYSDACKAGMSFTVMNASTRVREILELVGLEKFLLEQEASAEPGQFTGAAA